MRLMALVGVPLVLITAPLMLMADGPDRAPERLTPQVSEALDRISADSLRGHVSFLASDLLEGRGTPSKGLDIAAEYIAAQFRRAGLESIDGDDYYQTAEWKYLAPDPGSFACEVKLGDQQLHIGAGQVSGFLTTALDLPPTPLLKVDASDSDSLKRLEPEEVAGKIVLTEVPQPFQVPRAQMAKVLAAQTAFFTRMEELKPALVVDVERDPEGAAGLRQDTSGRRSARPPGAVPTIALHDRRLFEAFETLAAGRSDGSLSLQVGKPREQVAKVRNVVGVLRGSDPELRETYVLLSAHYDHLGISHPDGAGDRIYNGANDDASGTASVIEIASALATSKCRPKRSLVFLAFYGEEHGLIGSQYYTDHPVVPLEKTVAAINLEQVGRTDDSEGPRVAAATVTGYDFSDVGPVLSRAGQAVSIDVTKHPVLSDRYFVASDNAALARVGIPAHTISVAFQFPDYHAADDEWEKLDYANMAKVDRMAALGLLMIADGPAPRWNPDNPKAAPYREKAQPPEAQGDRGSARPSAAAFPRNGVTAHRGNSGEYAENTLPAFQSGIDLGADWLELDVVRTKDGKLVVIHDLSTGRVGDKDLEVSESTFEELRAVDVATDFRRRTGKSREACPPQAIPLLEDVLRLVMKQNRTRVSIQPKMDVVADAVALLRQLGAGRWAGFNEGNLSYMTEVKRLAPEIPVFWDRGGDTDIDDDIRVAKQRGFASLVLHSSGVTPEKIKKIKAAGIEVGAWTVNDRAAMESMLDLGVERLYTDHPRQLLTLKAGRQFRALPCEGGYPRHLQGIATNERDAIFWCFTDLLVKTDLDGQVVAKVPVANHHGDLCFHDGKLYVAVNLGEFNKPAGRADSWVFVYDAGTLRELARHKTPEVVHGAGGIAFQGGSFFVVGGLPAGIDENYVYEYSPSFAFRKRHVLASGATLMGIQTAAFADGHWWFGCYGKPQVLLKADPSFNLVGKWELDASLGIVGLPDGRLLVARGSSQNGMHRGRVVPAVADDKLGLRTLETELPKVE